MARKRQINSRLLALFYRQQQRVKNGRNEIECRQRLFAPGRRYAGKLM
jgi:hypothetical protein